MLPISPLQEYARITDEWHARYLARSSTDIKRVLAWIGPTRSPDRTLRLISVHSDPADFLMQVPQAALDPRIDASVPPIVDLLPLRIRAHS